MYVELGYDQVALAAALILLNGAVSFFLKLGLGRQLCWASVRTVAQLALIGLILKWIFELNRWDLVLLLAGLMTCIAVGAAVRRGKRRYPGIWLDGIISMWASSWLITGIALVAIVRVDPWYKPQYAIPLLGMILGNTLNGISLGLDRFGEELISHRGRVEMLLTLGATRWEAAGDVARSAIRTGMVPIINSMMVVGIVSLPGMMTGQLLAGILPSQAVKYQIVIMFLIASGTALGTVSMVLLGYRRLFNHRHQFRYQLLRSK